MWRYAVLGAVVIIIVIFGFSLVDVSQTDQVSGSAVVLGSPDPTGFARAMEPLDWQFPLNFGPHFEYQTEWWYYTGNVKTESGRHFGFQFTIFRRGLSPEAVETEASEWRANQLYMAHFTVSDIEGGRFFHDERFSRGSADLAGATIDPGYRVWLEDWEVEALNEDASLTQIRAEADQYAVELTLEQLKVPALQGIGGLSAKSAEPGNASHYYTLSRLATTGTITIEGETFTVTGTAWKDHEFSTSALGANALGWDWFGLQFDDQRELMVGQIRLIDGGRDPYFGGLLIHEDGTTNYLSSENFTIEALGSWTSPHTGAVYPSGWQITVSPPDEPSFTLTVTPQMLDQELHGGGIAYWEGSVRITGDATGYGYAELTGYVDAMTGRF